MKTDFFAKTGINSSFGYNSRVDMWERDWIIIEDNFGIKIKPTRYIYLTGSKYHEAEGHLKLIFYLQEDVINYALRIVK